MSIDGASRLAGIKVFVAEDEELVLMLVEDILADYGCQMMATATKLSEALEIVADSSLCVDVAILDVNLGANSSFPVAEVLAQREVPFVFATGSSAGDLPEAWRSRPTLQKPFVYDDVGRVLLALIPDKPTPDQLCTRPGEDASSPIK